MAELNVYEFHAAAIPGTESYLCDELRELGFKSVRLNRGGIPFRGDLREGWRACLESRLAQRVQLLMGRFPCRTPDDLYRGVQSIDWLPYLTFRQTLVVNAVTRGQAFGHSGFAALKIKDAIVDQIRDRTKRRPSVDREDADVHVFAHIANDKASVYLDLAGEPLHRRGYRKMAGEAPLRETLAATLVRMSGWDGEQVLVDPMCGSGTLLIEAAMWAAGIAPGLRRERFGFERWADFGEEAAETLRAMRGSLRQKAARARIPKLQAADHDPEMVEATTQNARAAGLKLAVKQRSVLDFQGSGKPGVLITNPPYGVRLEMTPGFCRELASTLSRLHGWRVCLLAGSPDYRKAISFAPKSAVALKNGALDCEFLVYDVP